MSPQRYCSAAQHGFGQHITVTCKLVTVQQADRICTVPCSGALESGEIDLPDASAEVASAVSKPRCAHYKPSWCFKLLPNFNQPLRNVADDLT